MQRRPVILDRRARRSLIVAAAVAVALAAAACLIRITHLSESRTPAGQPKVHDFTLANGVFTIQTSTWPAGASTIGGLGWKASVSPGLEPTIYQHAMHFTPPAGAVAGPVFDQRTFGIAPTLLLAAAICILLIVPIQRVPPGECVCGYRLDGGLDGNPQCRCPECGRLRPPEASR